MSNRPWVAPQEVKDYTEYPSVAKRADAKLSVDIARAEQYVISFTNNKFEDEEKYPTVPDRVKTAVILVAEAYAFNACVAAREMKSEQFDDYSYTTADAQLIDIPSLDIAPLLEDYIIEETRNGITLRMRKL